MIKKLYIIMRDFTAQMRRQNISAYAASTAFFLFLSLVPMLMVICTVIPYTPLTEANLLNVVTDMTPDTLDPLATNLISEVYDKSAGLLSLAVIVTIWSAAKGFMALMRGLNAINGVEEERNYLLVRLIASFYTVVMLLIMVLSLFIMVFGNQLVNLILYRLPPLQVLISFLMNFRFLVIWLVLVFLFSAIYAYVPNKKLRFREQIPGALFVSVSWSVFSWCFSLYVERPDAYSIYGSLSIIVIVMFWIYFCMYFVMIGAYLNRYFRPVNRVLFRKRESQEQ